MAFWSSAPPSPRPSVDNIKALRDQFDTLFERFGEVPNDMNFTLAQIGSIKGEWVQCKAAAKNKVILYFHGGGFITGSPKSHRALTARLVQASECSALCISYRLAPDHVFPAAVHDGIDAYRGLLADGILPGDIVLAGDGAGGGLAFAVALAIRNAGLTVPAGIAAMSPWADLSLSGWSILKNHKSDTTLSWEILFRCARHYLQKSNPADSYASPVFANFNNFPPIMVHAGSLEILRDDASRLGDRATEARIPVSVEIYDGMNHLFQADSQLAEAQVSLARLAQFIHSRTRSPSMDRAS
jgi:acetyl esterase/lipase